MTFYFDFQCFCLSKADKFFYQTIIQKTLTQLNDVIVANNYVYFYIQSNQICVKFTINAIVNYEIMAFGNWLLYVFDMCHSKIANLINPYNSQKCNMPHMNAVKDTMYSLVNKLIYEEQFNIVNLIFNAIKKIHISYTYDHYANQANFLFFIFLMTWFNLTTEDPFNVFSRVLNESLNINDFQNYLMYQPLMKYYKNNLSKHNMNNVDCTFQFENNLINYKKMNLKDWFDNNKITNMINEIINDIDFLKMIKNLSNN